MRNNIYERLKQKTHFRWPANNEKEGDNNADDMEGIMHIEKEEGAKLPEGDKG